MDNLNANLADLINTQEIAPVPINSSLAHLASHDSVTKAQNGVRNVQRGVGETKRSNFVVKYLLLILLALAVLGGLGVLLYLKGEQYDRQVQAALDNPNTKYTIKPADTRQPDDITVKYIVDDVLRYYDVSDFSDILFQEPDNLLGFTLEVLPSNPGANDGEFTLRFIPIREGSTWTGGMAMTAAHQVMNIVKDQLPTVNGITAELEAYAWYTEGHGNDGRAPVSWHRVDRDGNEESR
ncbi:hypothetical protein FACS1894125_4730 [Actinomycetota bacterium]|nr:hypothetical protein FACS1894125_4730 [Actinomycetota bacterium]